MTGHLPLGLALIVVGLGACTPPGVISPPVDDTDVDSESPDPDSEPPDVVDTAGPDTIPDAPDPSDELFSDDELPVFLIKILVENANRLQAEVMGGEHEYVEASFTYDEREYASVGIRLKGENSFEAFRSKPSIKVDFNRYVEDQALRGLGSITLNNMNDDYSMMHERLAYRVYRELGVPAYRVNHALVYVQEIDGEGDVISDRFYGLYSLLEDADNEMIARWFDDNDGSLWEIWDSDFYDGYVPCPNAYGSAGCFQLEYGEEDRDKIQAVADALELSGQAAIDAAHPHFDWEAWVNYWAGGALTAQFDAYPFANPGDDCHVYHDPTSDKLVFMPHGADETFYYGESDFTSVNGIVAQRCKAANGCMTAFRERVWEAYDISLEWDWLAYFDQVHDQIEPWVLEDTNHWYGDHYVWYYQDYMRDFIVGREAYLEAYAGPR
jgi:spore coat protein CotH